MVAYTISWTVSVAPFPVAPMPDQNHQSFFMLGVETRRHDVMIRRHVFASSNRETGTKQSYGLSARREIGPDADD
mgnify:CR=1 FL=1